MSTIKLRVHKLPEVSEKLIGTIKITPEAEAIVKQLQRESGLSCRSIVSQIVVQAVDMIEIIEMA